MPEAFLLPQLLLPPLLRQAVLAGRELLELLRRGVLQRGERHDFRRALLLHALPPLRLSPLRLGHRGRHRLRCARQRRGALGDSGHRLGMQAWLHSLLPHGRPPPLHVEPRRWSRWRRHNLLRADLAAGLVALVPEVEHEEVCLHRRRRLEDARGLCGGWLRMPPTEERILGGEVKANSLLDAPQAAQPAHRQDRRVAQPSLRPEDAECRRHALARDILGHRRPAGVTAFPEHAAAGRHTLPEDGLGTANTCANLVLGALTRKAVIHKELLGNNKHGRARGLPASRAHELFLHVKAEATQTRHPYRPTNG